MATNTFYPNPNHRDLPNRGNGNSASSKVFEKTEHRKTRTQRSKEGPHFTSLTLGSK